MILFERAGVQSEVSRVAKSVQEVVPVRRGFSAEDITIPFMTELRPGDPS